MIKDDKNLHTLILLCGKPASGKTTLRNKIVDRYKDITYLSCDEEMLEKYGEIKDSDEFATKLNLTKDRLYNKAKKLLNNNTNVVLDFGFWYREERAYLREYFKDYNCAFIYLNVDNITLLNNMNSRNKNLKQNEYFMDEATLQILASKFEDFSESEEHIDYSCDKQVFCMLDTILVKNRP